MGQSIFSNACKFCLAHGPRQLTSDVKMTPELKILEVTSLMHLQEKDRMTFGEDRYETLKVKKKGKKK